VTTLARVALAAAVTAAAGAFYAVYVERRWLRVTRTRLHFADLPPQLEGLRIALITDIHAGPLLPRRLLARVLAAAAREWPDLVAVCGDLADGGHPERLPGALDQLARLRAPLGVHVVPGNHDHRNGIDHWHREVARRPTLTDLTNAVRVLRVGAGAAAGAGADAGADRGADSDADGRADAARLCIAGVDDLSEGEPRLDMLPPRGERDFTILLAHQPDQAEHVRRASDDIDLVLSGHTHGGQVRLPWIGALVNSADRTDLYESGVRRRPWTQVYTSAGIGAVHLPVRFLARPELAVLTLTGAARPQW
jgi:uncharacterized protein